MHPTKLLVLRIPFLLPLIAAAQLAKMAPTYHDEAQVPAYTLPDPLRMEDGTRVTDAAQWPARRAQLMELFAAHQYGFPPRGLPALRVENVLDLNDALPGGALLRQLDLVLTRAGRECRLQLLICLPNEAATQPVPAFLGLNFYGNHTVHADPRIRMPQGWSPNSETLRVTENKATNLSRGLRAYRWPVERILARGYALVTLYSGDINPDRPDGFDSGLHRLFSAADFDCPSDQRWGTVAAWAWGLSRVLDYLENEPWIDARRVIAIGHSRKGKAALWAGATDPRFAAVVANGSGCAGAALHRRRFGERMVDLNTHYPHWLTGRAKAYNEREDELPVDQHQLVALIAPRPVHVSSAEEDLWADPRGEFLSLVHADPVYRLLGLDGLPSHHMPAPGNAVPGRLSYHIRPGPHDILEQDWARFLDFADRQVCAGND
jgi:hypothetical protein